MRHIQLITVQTQSLHGSFPKESGSENEKSAISPLL